MKTFDNRVINGDGRDLSFLEDGSIDCIITDHPWLDEKANKGGNRNFAKYDTFEYTLEDFKEKARVLKDGCFLVEMLPAENATNFDYLYKIKKFHFWSTDVSKMFRQHVAQSENEDISLAKWSNSPTRRSSEANFIYH